MIILNTETLTSLDVMIAMVLTVIIVAIVECI